MEFRRIPGLPPYVFTIIDGLKQEARRAGRDVVDLGFGNPDLPSPEIAVEKLAEAARNTRNHRYSASRGILKLRQAVSALYLRNFGVELDPETEVLSTIRAEEGFSHLMWVLLQLVDWARERDVVLVHDFAYADVAFDGWTPPSILQCEGAKDCAVELYSMTKSFSMAGWRVAFLVGNAEVVAALTKLKSYLDYGTFQPIQTAATVTMNEAPDYPAEVNEVYESRRNALVDGLARIGWEVERPRGTMFVWAPIPEPYRELGSIEFAKLIVNDCDVAVSPGIGFGPGGDGFVRFALIENEQRIVQAVRQLKRGLPKLG